MGSAELFPDDIPQDQRPKRLPFPLFPGRFVRLKVAYEDMIFAALGLLLLLLGGFCLGVERGRGQVMRSAIPDSSMEVSSAVAHAASRQGAEPETIPPVSPIIPAAVSLPPRDSNTVPGPEQGAYAIQLASYVGPQAAQEEVRRLTRQGVTAQVVRQGKYFELRAVGYRSLAEAKRALADLRKTYRDAFPKRLTSSGG